MDSEGFGKFLEGRGLSQDEIDRSLAIVKKYEIFLQDGQQGRTLKTASREDAQAFSAVMIDQELNSYDNYVALARYGLFSKNKDLYISVLELLDGSEALGNLHRKVAQQLSAADRDEIFAGIQLPPLGTPNSRKPGVMSLVVDRLEKVAGAETCKKILGSGLRDLEYGWYEQEKKKFTESRDIDDYLEKKGQDFIAQLKDIKDQEKLFFNQEITDEVISYVDRVPEIRQGVREGNILFEVKIPHMAKEYLAETDDSMKRYYYCHCPWVKESLKTEQVKVPPIFCNCSAAFHKKPWEVIFDQPLQAEIVESVLLGDQWCKIAIHLPDQVIPEG